MFRRSVTVTYFLPVETCATLLPPASCHRRRIFFFETSANADGRRVASIRRECV